MKVAARLPFRVDPKPLQADLAGIDPGEWKAHFNASYFDGAWTGVALRAPSQTTETLYHDPAAAEFVDTAVLRSCPNLAGALALLECPLRSAR